MAKREVGIYFRAYDQTSRPLHGIGAGLKSLQRQVIGLAGAYIGVRGLTGAIGSFVAAAAKQEEAEIALHAAVGANIAQFKSYASEMQKRTRYGDEAILAEMAYGANLGVTTDRLQDATTAAIGLAAKYRIDLRSAMMLVGRASQGQTQMLTRYGIVLDETLTDQQKFDELLRIGASSMDLAESAATSYAGQMDQLKNAWGDAQEILGQALLPKITEAATAMRDWLTENQEQIRRWASDFSEGVAIVVGAMDRLSTRTTSAHARFNQFGDAAQKSIQEAYKSQTGQTFGMTTTVAPGLMGGAAITTWKEPQDIGYFNRLLDSYERALGRREALIQQAKEPTYDSPLLPQHGPAAPTAIDYDAAYKSVMASYKKETGQTTIDIASAYRRMYGDLDRMTADSVAVRLNLLAEERDAIGRAIEEQSQSHEEMLRGKDLLDRWYAEQKQQEDIRLAKAEGGFFKGFGAGVRQMQREVKTIGELGAEAAETIRDGLADAFTDAILDAKNLGDALKELGRSLARMMLQTTMQQTVTGVMGALGFDMKPSARGNVFDSSGLVPFARGGVVDRPTVFPFARGVGLMGEAGTEAIMPLQRDSRGRLGVHGGGMDTGRIEALLTTLIDVQNRVANQKMVLVDRRSGVTKDQVAGVIIDDLEHGGPISTRIGMGT